MMNGTSNRALQNGSSPFQDSQPSQHESTNGHTERLPRALRAVQDGGNAISHGRTLVICLDGTGDRYDDDNSNIVNFVSCLKKHTPADQVTYYQSGIGTYDKGGLSKGLSAAMDMAVGSGLGMHVKGAYRFLMQTYRDGDKICLLGFSRGAYTVRCLAGMLHKVGLLPASNGSQVNFAYQFYRDNTPNGRRLARGFKRTFCTHVSVHFVGVWDCVASVGFIPRQLPLSKSPTNSIRFFRHAMALDERRSKFKVCQWVHADPDKARSATNGISHDCNDHITKSNQNGAADGHSSSGRLSKLLHRQPKMEASFADTSATKDHDVADLERGMEQAKRDGVPDRDSLEAKFLAQDKANKRFREFETDALEVWFMGAHADVGGGAVPNESRHMLSRIPFRWMIRQCFECNTAIMFDTARLAEFGLDVHTLWPKYIKPAIPVAGPPQALLEKYHNKTLAPLHRRSIFLPIGPEVTRIDDAPSAKILNYILPSEADEDYFDSREKPNDQLEQKKAWWILEVWPVKMRVLSNDLVNWEKRLRMNLGRHRAVREHEPKIHWTAKRMFDNRLYSLKTRVSKDSVWVEWA